MPAKAPLPLTCPTCGSVLLLDPAASYRCTLGHFFSAEQLAEAQAPALVRTLWATLRQLEERQWLLNQLATRSGQGSSLPQPDIEEVARQLRGLVEAFADPGAPTQL